MGAGGQGLGAHRVLADYSAERAHARSIRRRILEAVHRAGTGHLGPSFSAVELLVSLFFRHLRYRPDEPGWPERDAFVLGKGHAAPALYAVLAELGVIPAEEMLTLRRFGSRLQGHPSETWLPAVEVSTGSLGQSLSVALGMCIGWARAQRPNRAWVLLGDGELQEGQVWEAAMAAPRFTGGNLIAVVDRNGLQNDGATESIVPLGDLAAKWRAFGWDAVEVDGHDFAALDRVFGACAAPSARPRAIIARTVKGKGVSFMENAVEWHHHPLDDEQLAVALRELEADP